jgi:hypothetical protein
MAAVCPVGRPRAGVVCLAALAWFARTARGQEAVAGWEGNGTSGYAFARPVLSLAPASRHQLIVFATASYLYYRFLDQAGFTRVTSPGIGGSLGYRLNTPSVTATLAIGYEVRHTTERPKAPPFPVSYGERGPALEGELSLEADPRTEINALATWSGADGYGWARAGIARRLTPPRSGARTAFSLGGEATFQGNSDVRAWQAGPLLVVELLPADASLELRVGLGRTRYTDAPGENRPYFGLTLYRAF